MSDFDRDYYEKRYGPNWREDAPRVWAFQPRRRDAPHGLAYDDEELRGMVGDLVSAEQCDGCGNNVYRIEGVFRFYAVCAADPVLGREFRHEDPCGARYPIGEWFEYEVIVPAGVGR